MRTTAWNTGRKYTDEGQRLAAVFVDGRINFVDVDRCIEGEILLAPPSTRLDVEVLDDATIQMVVMTHYDLGRFIPWFQKTEEDRLLKSMLVTQARGL